MGKIPVALQLFTVRNEAQADYVGTLRTVAEIGYAGVELAGCPIPAKDIKTALDDLGLAAPSGHFGYDEIVTNTAQTIETARILGLSYVTCPGWFVKDRTADGYRRTGQELSKAGEEFARNGLGLAYHNHSHEFEVFDGKFGLDILFESGDPRYLKAQVDSFWVQFAGQDAAAYILRYSGRCPMIHVKDMAEDKKSFAEVGNGIMDWTTIFKACETAGTEWYIVEQDDWYGANPIDCIRTSFENLKRMGAA